MNTPFMQGLLFGIIIMIVFNLGCYVASPPLRSAIKSMLRRQEEDFGDEEPDDED